MEEEEGKKGRGKEGRGVGEERRGMKGMRQGMRGEKRGGGGWRGRGEMESNNKKIINVLIIK